MLIWILVLVLLASGIGMGLRLGAICSAFSFVGVVFATFLAHPIGRLFKPLVAHIVGPEPLMRWVIPTIIGFLLVYCVIMAAGIEVHRRVGVFYKYKAGDLKLALWERLNHRVGGCLGVLNGLAWIVLACFVFFNWSYWTVQVDPSQGAGKVTHVVNNLGYGMQSTGLDKAARALGSMPNSFYRTADFAGLLVQNPRLTTRLANYPAFISVAERTDVQPLGQDSGLGSELNNGTGQLLNDPTIQSIIQNTNLMATVWSIVQTNMDDITNFLISGNSPKFEAQKIIGHWQFDVVPALGALLESQPKIRPNDLKAIRALWTQAFAQTTFVAGSDGQAYLKNLPDFKKNPPDVNNWTGQWTDNGFGTNYGLTLNLNNQSKVATGQTDGLRLTLKMGENTYVFQRAY